MGGGGVELWFSRGVNKIMERDEQPARSPEKKFGLPCLACLLA